MSNEAVQGGQQTKLPPQMIPAGDAAGSGAKGPSQASAVRPVSSGNAELDNDYKNVRVLVVRESGIDKVMRDLGFGSPTVVQESSGKDACSKGFIELYQNTDGFKGADQFKRNHAEQLINTYCLNKQQKSKLFGQWESHIQIELKRRISAAGPDVIFDVKKILNIKKELMDDLSARYDGFNGFINLAVTKAIFAIMKEQKNPGLAARVFVQDALENNGQGENDKYSQYPRPIDKLSYYCSGSDPETRKVMEKLDGFKNIAEKEAKIYIDAATWDASIPDGVNGTRVDGSQQYFRPCPITDRAYIEEQLLDTLKDPPATGRLPKKIRPFWGYPEEIRSAIKFVVRAAIAKYR